MKTLAQLKEAVYRRGYEDDQGGRIAGFANDAVTSLLNDHRYLFATVTATIAVVAGTTTYSLPADVLHVDSLRLTYSASPTPPELDPVTADEMLELLSTDPAASSTGGPQVWAQTAIGTVSVYPAPIGGTLTVRYQRTLDEVDDDSDELPVPDNLFYVVVYDVCRQLAERERQWESTDRFAATRDARLDRIKAQLGLGQRQNAGRVGFSGDKSYENQADSGFTQGRY